MGMGSSLSKSMPHFGPSEAGSLGFAISSVSQAQSIPAESPPAAAIRRENDTKWLDAFTQQNFASSQTSWQSVQLADPR
jgi:hypothetical protein